MKTKLTITVLIGIIIGLMAGEIRPVIAQMGDVLLINIDTRLRTISNTLNQIERNTR